jgi:hypothetical protein
MLTAPELVGAKANISSMLRLRLRENAEMAQLLMQYQYTTGSVSSSDIHGNYACTEHPEFDEITPFFGGILAVSNVRSTA